MKRNILFLLFTLYFSPIRAQPVDDAELIKQGFREKNRPCVIVEGEPPILKSEIEKRSEQKGISFKAAEDELTDGRLLWFHARKQLKYDIPGIEKAAAEHVKKIKENNGLTEAKFEELLNKPPYEMSVRQFQYETATAILENNVKATISNQTAISDEQVRQRAALLKAEMSHQFDVVFISVLPDVGASGVGKGTSQGLSAQFKKANEIKLNLTGSATINDVKKIYEHNPHISIVGPLMYKQGSFDKPYEERIEKNPKLTVIGPFEDKKAVSLMWKIRRPVQNLDETALENLRKELYDKAVMEKFKAETDALKNSSTVIVKGCKKP